MMEVNRRDFETRTGEGPHVDRFSTWHVDASARVEIDATGVRLCGHLDLSGPRFMEAIALLAKAHALSRWYALAPADADTPSDEMLHVLTQRVHADLTGASGA